MIPIMVALALGCIVSGIATDLQAMLFVGAVLCGVCVVLVQWDVIGYWVLFACRLLVWLPIAIAFCLVWLPLVFAMQIIGLVERKNGFTSQSEDESYWQ